MIQGYKVEELVFDISNEKFRISRVSDTLFYYVFWPSRGEGDLVRLDAQKWVWADKDRAYNIFYWRAEAILGYLTANPLPTWFLS